MGYSYFTSVVDGNHPRYTGTYASARRIRIPGILIPVQGGSGSQVYLFQCKADPDPSDQIDSDPNPVLQSFDGHLWLSQKKFNSHNNGTGTYLKIFKTKILHVTFEFSQCSFAV